MRVEIGGLVRALAVAAAFVANIAGSANAADTSTSASASSTCPQSIGDAVALQVDGETPVVAGRDGALARFDIAFDANHTTARLAHPATIRCTASRNVVGIAIDAHGNTFVAEPSRVRVYARDGSNARNAFSPELAAGESIVAIALLADGSIELAVASNSSPSPARYDATGTVSIRFLAYGAKTAGERVSPARSFGYGAFLARPSGITIDTEGRTYAYDDGGEVLVFDAKLSGSATPIRRFYGPSVALWPAVRGTVPGSRQLALDENGYLYAQDDGIVTMLPIFDSIPPRGLLFACDPTKLAIGRGLASTTSAKYVLTIDPETHAAAIRVAVNGGGTSGPCVNDRTEIDSIPLP